MFDGRAYYAKENEAIDSEYLESVASLERLVREDFPGLAPPFRDFFRSDGEWLLHLDGFEVRVYPEYWLSRPLEELRDENRSFFAIQSRTASPELRRLNASVNAIVNVYARAVNPNGVGTQSDKDHAREIIDSAFSSGDFKAATSQMMMEVGAEKKAPGVVKGEMRTFFTGKSNTNNAPNTNQQSDEELIQKYLNK